MPEIVPTVEICALRWKLAAHALGLDPNVDPDPAMLRKLLSPDPPSDLVAERDSLRSHLEYVDGPMLVSTLQDFMPPNCTLTQGRYLHKGRVFSIWSWKGRIGGLNIFGTDREHAAQVVGSAWKTYITETFERKDP